MNVVYLQQEKLYSCVINVAKSNQTTVYIQYFSLLCSSPTHFFVYFLFFAFAFLPVISTPNFHHFDSLIHLVFQCAISNTFTQFSVLLFPIFSSEIPMTSSKLPCCILFLYRGCSKNLCWTGGANCFFLVYWFWDFIFVCWRNLTVNVFFVNGKGFAIAEEFF